MKTHNYFRSYGNKLFINVNYISQARNIEETWAEGSYIMYKKEL